MFFLQLEWGWEVADGHGWKWIDAFAIIFNGFLFMGYLLLVDNEHRLYHIG